jgi:hypothetical protein
MRPLEPVTERDSPAHRHHRVALGIGGDQAGGEVGGAGARGHQDDAGRPGQPTDTRCDERGILLMPADDQLRPPPARTS